MATYSKINYINPKELIPYEKNTKKHPDVQIQKLSRLMENYGFPESKAILVDENSVIIAGHGRREAAINLKLTEVPYQIVTGISDADVKAMRIADNAIAESEWDYEMLKDEYQYLESEDYEMDLLSLDDEHLDEMDFLTLDDENDDFDESKEDEIPEEKDVETRVKKGDIWQLGNHYIMCGDCTNEKNIKQLLCKKKVDMLFTSPPYGVSLEYDEYNDEFENTLKLISTLLPLACKYVDDYIVLNWDDIVSGSKINKTEHPSQYSWFPIYNNILNKKKWFLWAQRIWVKPHARCSGIWSATSNRPVSDWEYVFTWAKKSPKYNIRANDSHFGIIDSRDNKQTDTLAKHPGAFPVCIAEKAILIHSEHKSSVFDTFLGSGTTLIACEKTNRICYGMEISEKYCDVIIGRWENLTGNNAKLINKI